MADPITQSAPASPLPPPPHQTTYLWVAPAVSFAVLLGFFSILFLLVQLQIANSQPSSTKADSSKAGNSKADSSKADSSKADSGKADSSKADSSKADSSKADGSKADNQPATPGNLQNVLFTLLGALGAAFTQVVNYWLGSSKGSADKTEILKTKT